MCEWKGLRRKFLERNYKSSNLKLWCVDPKPATGTSDTDLAEPAAAANQGATAIDAAAGCGADAAPERRF